MGPTEGNEKLEFMMTGSARSYSSVRPIKSIVSKASTAETPQALKLHNKSHVGEQHFERTRRTCRSMSLRWAGARHVERRIARSHDKHVRRLPSLVPHDLPMFLVPRKARILPLLLSRTLARCRIAECSKSCTK